MYNVPRIMISSLVLVLAMAFTGGCSKEQQDTTTTGKTGAKAKAPTKYRIAVIAKSQGNQVFQAARVGAEDAAKDLGTKHGLDIDIIWQTPNDEDPQKQAEFIEQLSIMGIHGITISCSDASTVTFAIDKAVSRGVAVMCFDSDAPESKRFCYYGVDDIECGRAVMRELAAAIGEGGGRIAVLAGNQTAPNLQRRVQGVREEAAKHPNIAIVDVYYHTETAQDASAKVEEVQATHPDIAGWAMVGGWPLFADSLLKWEPGKVKIVSVDALPEQLQYVRAGVAQVLLAQEVYLWGYRSVELIIDKVHFKKDPPKVQNTFDLIRVTKKNVDAYEKNWDKWLRRGS